jgi:hypothetical protein
VECVVNSEATPPPELELAWLCGDYHLPNEGGVKAQDYIEYTRMKALQNIHRVVSKFRSLQGDSVNTALSVNERILLEQLRVNGHLKKIGLNRGRS